MGCSSSKPATWGEDPQWGAEAESGVGGSVGTSTSYTVAPAASSAERGRSGGGALQPATPGAVGAASAAQGKGPSVAPGLIDKLRANFLVTATQGSVYDYYTLDKTLGASPSPPRLCASIGGSTKSFGEVKDVTHAATPGCVFLADRYWRVRGR